MRTDSLHYAQGIASRLARVASDAGRFRDRLMDELMGMPFEQRPRARAMILALSRAADSAGESCSRIEWAKYS